MKWFFPDAALAGYGMAFDTRASAILANIPAQINFVITGGYNLTTDNGGGKYRKIGAVPAHPGYFTSVDGAIWELVPGDNNVNQFGAYQDNIVDCTDAFNNASLYSNFFKVAINILGGTHKITGTILRPANTVFHGTTLISILRPNGNFDLFRFVGSYTETTGIYINNVNRTGGFEINFDLAYNNTSQLEHRFTDWMVVSSFGLCKDTYVAGGYVHYRIYFNNVKAQQQRGPGYVLTRAFAYWYIDERCLVEYINSVDPNYLGFSCDCTGLPAGAGGFEFGLQIAGTAKIGATSVNQRGAYFKNAAAVIFDGCLIDTMGGYGLTLDTCNNCTFKDFRAMLCDGYGIDLINCTYIFGLGIINTRGRNTIAHTTNVPNIRISGALSNFITLGNVFTNEATDCGVMVETGTGVVINQLTSVANATYGLWAKSTADYVTVHNADYSYNVVGNLKLDNVTAGKQVSKSNRISSGAFVDLYSSPVTA